MPHQQQQSLTTLHVDKNHNRLQRIITSPGGGTCTYWKHNRAKWEVGWGGEAGQGEVKPK